MPKPPSPDEVASSLLAEKGLQLQSLKVIQSLWAGYGYICRLQTSSIANMSPNSSGSTTRTSSTANSGISTPLEAQPGSYILKLITPPPAKSSDEGHIRKILSYKVEQYFYTHLAPQLPASIPVANCLASISEQHPDGSSTTAMILSDLKQTFPLAGDKRAVLSTVQVHAAIDWLASFHGFWWPRVKTLDRALLVRPPLEEAQLHQLQGGKSMPTTVWLNGGYTYLSTRRSEFATLAADHDSEWNEPLTDWLEGDVSLAEMVADVLAPKEKGWGPSEEYMTLIHGDVKSENLFTTNSGEDVVFYDFQYTGLGLGVCDLAKLFTCSVPLGLLTSSSVVPDVLAMQPEEELLLRRYLAKVKNTARRGYDWDIFVRHWETALVDWLRFQASWGFWGNTDWLEARVRYIIKDERWRQGVVGNRTYAERGTVVD